MKRYYIAAAADVQALAAGGLGDVGEYHYIDLGSHGAAGAGFVVVVLVNETKTPPANWQALPHLLDATTTVGALPAAAGLSLAPAVTPLQLMGDIGVTGSQGGYVLAKQLAAIHSKFAP